VEAIEHALACALETFSEKSIQVSLVVEVGSCNSNGAGIAVLLVGTAFSIDGGDDLALNVDHFLWVPVLEGGMVRDEVCHFWARVVSQFCVHAVLHVFLHVSIQEEVETGKIAE